MLPTAGCSQVAAISAGGGLQLDRWFTRRLLGGSLVLGKVTVGMSQLVASNLQLNGNKRLQFATKTFTARIGHLPGLGLHASQRS